jgi:hypothetical protein
MSLAHRIVERIPEVVNDASKGAKELIIPPSPDIISPATNVPFNTITLIAMLGVSFIVSGIVIWKAVNWLIPKFNLQNS